MSHLLDRLTASVRSVRFRLAMLVTTALIVTAGAAELFGTETGFSK